jgi:hypothetical protein
MASWSSGLGSPGFCSEMSLPALWSDCIKKCLYGVNREVFLRGLKGSLFFLWDHIRVDCCGYGEHMQTAGYYF